MKHISTIIQSIFQAEERAYIERIRLLERKVYEMKIKRSLKK